MPTKLKLKNKKNKNKHRALLVTADSSLLPLYDSALDHQIIKDHASSYQEVQDYCKNHSPDILFLDQALPDGSAENLINEFYQHYYQTVIVLIVEQLNDDFVLKIWDKVNELLRKPLDATSFLKIIQIYCNFNDPSIAPHQFVTQQIARKFVDPDFSEKEIAEALGITPAYLSKMYKEKTGMRFQEVLQKTRINTARKLLKNTDLLIKQVAAKVGYRRVDSFIRNFQKSLGISPSEFRRKTRISAQKLKYRSSKFQKL
jgi:AraC-like DNA-binding protein